MKVHAVIRRFCFCCLSRNFLFFLLNFSSFLSGKATPCIFLLVVSWLLNLLNSNILHITKSKTTLHPLKKKLLDFEETVDGQTVIEAKMTWWSLFLNPWESVVANFFFFFKIQSRLGRTQKKEWTYNGTITSSHSKIDQIHPNLTSQHDPWTSPT